jgi:hypothetical protein
MQSWDLWPSSEPGPPQCVQAALLGLGVEPDRGDILSWSDVPADRRSFRGGIGLNVVVWSVTVSDD